VVEKRVRRKMAPYPIFKQWIKKDVKGVAEVLTGGIVAGIDDIGRFETVSKLWKFCGVGLNEDGTIQKRVKGQKINFNPFLKTLCWKIGEQFVKISTRGYYGELLLMFKERELQKAERAGKKVIPWEAIVEIAEERAKKNGVKMSGRKQAEWMKEVDVSEYMSAGHVHARAKRAAVKIFLSHLFQVWREIEGLPVTKPYEIVRGEILQAIRSGATPGEAGRPHGIHETTVQEWLKDPDYDSGPIHHHYQPPGWGEDAEEKAAD
jgi:hypothetical protein